MKILLSIFFGALGVIGVVALNLSFTAAIVSAFAVLFTQVFTQYEQLAAISWQVLSFSITSGVIGAGLTLLGVAVVAVTKEG